ncbi:MAG: LysM peptidoglycan-binding domain-containing protein [Sphaerobacter sp.]|nr:LysM peptidoglycan-binding domain-containing protein [Sphaerobacter sp.]
MCHPAAPAPTGHLRPGDGRTARPAPTPTRPTNGTHPRAHEARVQAVTAEWSVPTYGAYRTASATSTAAPRRARLLPQRWPRTVSGIGRRALGHALLLAVILAVVLGHGYWTRSRQVARSGGIDAIGDLRTTSLLLSASAASTAGASYAGGTHLLAATASGSVLSGYVSQLATAVAPDQLQITSVTVAAGETVADVAQRTGRSTSTLLWANGLSNPAEPLPAGTQLRVPPVDGMLHIVHDGDTLESIAARYGVTVEAITGYKPNNVERNADLVPYRMLMVPGGSLPTRDKVLTYTVRPGDTLSSIAQFFGLQPSTIVWANSLPNGDLILPGQHLAILPTDGVMVTVAEGDTVESLAAHYGVEPQAIRDYPLNGLGAGGQLRVGQQVMIPGGKPPAPPPPPAPQPSAPSEPAAPAAPAPGGGSGRFIWPTAGVITQYFGPTDFWMEPAYAGYAHFHQGLDIANGFGTPIVAADSGVVIFAGWHSGGLGNAVAIDHGNGFVTWYGHMNARPAVSVGQWVAQGEYLGPMGSTGASTGAHLHFVIIKGGVYVDPLAYLG